MIQYATKADLEAVYRLICILEQQELDKKYFTDTYLHALKDEDVVYLVYKKDNDIQGFLSFVIHHYLHHHHNTGEIVELVVNPHQRGQSIGQELLEAVEKIAYEKKLEQIELSTSTYRTRAHHFYEKNGYVMNHYNYTKDL